MVQEGKGVDSFLEPAHANQLLLGFEWQKEKAREKREESPSAQFVKTPSSEHSVIFIQSEF